ncbi:hypothetical protein [Paenibacillus sp. FSL R10-2734]|uniref:hypothetical protein n=1 Tax=Paenibacillus sp. FSL R10-2734 TaxID=2954691 RepID=UPI0030D9BF0A
MNNQRTNRHQDLEKKYLKTYIYRDLAQLEATIQYQIDNNWKSETLVIQKLDDAIESVLLNIGTEKDDDKDALLWSLLDYINKFKVGDEILDVRLNDEQRTNYIFLGEKLRSNGWTFDKGFDTNWNAFASKVKKLITESTIQDS